MQIAFGTDKDDARIDLLIRHLQELGHEVRRLFVGGDWVEVGRGVAEAVADGEFRFGVVCCTTGTGVTIAANKVRGVRAALCRDTYSAIGARRWNDANVLGLAMCDLDIAQAGSIVDAFVTSAVDDDERATITRVEAT